MCDLKGHILTGVGRVLQFLNCSFYPHDTGQDVPNVLFGVARHHWVVVAKIAWNGTTVTVAVAINTSYGLIKCEVKRTTVVRCAYCTRSVRPVHGQAASVV